MASIRKLSKKTINQIAAGEVIERPASVVKELVENSLDAEASVIKIDIVNGGTKLIRVTDNGKGIEESDFELAFKKHTTSKITDIDDVYSLKTMGFRGEALASIASVSRLEAISRSETSSDSNGKRVHIKGGEQIFLENTPANKGTIIKVMDLFFNLPARKKHLKKIDTEKRHIITIITDLAIINPEVHFILTDNNREILNIPRSKDLKNNLFHILGSEVVRNLAEVKGLLRHSKVHGFIGLPNTSRATRSGQWFYVNGRPIKSNVIREAMEDSTKGLLMRNKYPIAVLSLDIDPNRIDVNIHPSKKEIRFETDEEIYALIFEAVNRGFEKHGLITDHNIIPKEHLSSTNLGKEEPKLKYPEIDSQFQTTLLTEVREPLILDKTIPLLNMEDFGKQLNFELYNYYKDNFHRHQLPFLIPLGQAHDLYIICKTQEGILLIDQHALHERIRLEEVKEEYRKRSVKTQELIIPLDLELKFEEAQVFDQWKHNLSGLGFEIEHFGEKTYRIRSIPASIDYRQVRELVKDIIDKLLQNKGNIDLEDMEDEILKMTACRTAIKAGEKLDRKGIINLLKKMYLANNPYLCAHGRPTMVKLSLDELEKRFKRKI